MSSCSSTGSLRRPPSREGTSRQHILQTLVCHRVIDPGSEWRLHRQWFEASAMGNLLGEDYGLVAKNALYRCLTDFIAQDTDRAASWSDVPGLEFYFRDCVFNRGAGGAVRILQRALAVPDDGVFGHVTRAALAIAQQDASGFLPQLRAAREDYERTVVERDETSKFWKGLVNRWNNALKWPSAFQ
jgi:hypothetical protein